MRPGLRTPASSRLPASATASHPAPSPPPCMTATASPPSSPPRRPPKFRSSASASRSRRSDVDTMRLVGELGEDRIDAALPAAVGESELVFRRAASAGRDVVEDVEEAALVAALRIKDGATLEAGARDREHILGKGLHAALAHLRTQGGAGNVAAQLLALGQGPVLTEVPGGIERLRIVEQSDPQRRQGAQPLPRSAVGAAHLQEALQPDLRERGRQMVHPVAHAGYLARQRRQLAPEEI